MRQRLAAAAAAAAVVVVVALVVLSGRDGDTVFRHEGDPAFTLLYDEEQVVPVEAEPGELLRMRGARRELVTTLTVEPVRLPAYEGDAVGALPVFADNYARERELRLTTDTRARLGGAPGYELGYDGGATLIVVPDEPGARDGVVLTVTEEQPDERDRGGGQRVARAMRSALRSFEFGAERD